MSRFFVQLLSVLLLQSNFVFAQWAVKPKIITKQSPDDHISLIINLPVLVGDYNPEARKAINHTLGKISLVDELVRDAKRMIHEHQRALLDAKKLEAAKNRMAKSGKRPRLGDNDELENLSGDFADEHTLDFGVGLNDGKIFSICLDGYWHGGGGAVGNPYSIGCIFSATTGARLEPGDLFVTSWEKLVKHVAKERLRKSDVVSDDMLFNDWEKRVDDAEIGFYISLKKDLVLCFGKYSIAPGSSGVIMVNVPLVAIKDMIPSTSPIFYLSN